MTEKEIRLTAELGRDGGRWPHSASLCVGAGRAAEGLRADWQHQLGQAVTECGFRYLRFHGLLSDDMHLCYLDGSGKIAYSWQYVDSLFDALLAIPVRPFVEFGFCPGVLASGGTTQFWWQGRVDPPADLHAWANLLTALCRHWLERYGAQEVRRWYFEIWNEPDLRAFWNGTRSQYFALYAVSVRAIKAVDAALRVGGPATSNFVPDARFDGETEDRDAQRTVNAADLDAMAWHGVWIREFLAYCAAEKLPVDFVSTHPYPTDFALDGQDNGHWSTRKAESLQEDIAWLKETVALSAYPQAELCLTEWSSSPSSRDFAHDHLPAACYIARAACAAADSVRCLSYWVFTDIFEELGGGHDAFHGGFGLMNFNGIKKPAYHAYRMLNRLGDVLVARTDQGIVTLRNGKLRALFWNYSINCPQTVPMARYPDWQSAWALERQGTHARLTLSLTGLHKNAVLHREMLDTEHGCAAAAWHRMGEPKNLTQRQEQALRDAAEATEKTQLSADANGRLQVQWEMAPWALVLLWED